jgi:carbon-monoxide dehydrogenase medium subunit
MDIAVVGVAASVVLDARGQTIVSARIGLGAVAPTPLFAREASELLAGQPIDGETMGRAAQAARAAARPITDMRGTREFRLHLVEILTGRVLRTAIARASEQTE